jgi:UDP-glucuronate 4-epimerase
MASSRGTVFITGAAGFIGSNVAIALAGRGQRVVGIDSFDPFYDRRFKEANLARATRECAGKLTFLEADMCDGGAMRSLLGREKPSAVIHLAAKAGVRPSLADPVGYSHCNLTGTASMLSAAESAGCDRFIFASSSSVYGNCPVAPFSETADVDEPVSPYATTKRAGELMCWTHHRLTQMPTACLRFFTVYGPRQRPDLAISLFMGKIARGEPITVFGDPGSSRDYTYIDDIVDGVVAALDRIPQHGYRVWNLGNSTPVRLDDMISTIARVVGKEPNMTRGPAQKGDVDRTWADLTRSAAELGYQPRVKFEEGVRRQYEWLRQGGWNAE